jgi:hypothetical protein
MEFAKSELFCLLKSAFAALHKSRRHPGYQTPAAHIRDIFSGGMDQRPFQGFRRFCG